MSSHRLALTAVALLAPIAGLGMAAPTVEVVTGRVTPAVAERFTDYVADRNNSLIGLDVTVRPGGSADAGLRVNESARGGAFITWKSPEGGVQLTVPNAVRKGGGWTARGVYHVRYQGVGKGVMTFELTPASESELRAARATMIEKDVGRL